MEFRFYMQVAYHAHVRTCAWCSWGSTTTANYDIPCHMHAYFVTKYEINKMLFTQACPITVEALT